MTTYKSFEELPCWQEARELCRMVFALISCGALSKDFALKDQIWRAAGGVMDNIAEGYDDSSSREFVKFLGYAQRSCSEVQSQLYRALDCAYLSKDAFDGVFLQAEECRKQVKGFRKYLRGMKEFRD